MSNKKRVYRVRVLSVPVGSLAPGWIPADIRSGDLQPGERWAWPAYMRKRGMGLSSPLATLNTARKYAAKLERFGAQCAIEQSQELQWEEDSPPAIAYAHRARYGGESKVEVP